MKKYPISCLRGIRKPDWITPENKVSGVAFDPDKKTKKSRADGGIETSINWEDKESVLKFSLNTQNYQHGAVRLLREQIDQINNEPITETYLSYDRDKLKKNPYHGNIVFRSNLSPKFRRTLAGSLAQRSSLVIRKDDIEANVLKIPKKLHQRLFRYLTTETPLKLVKKIIKKDNNKY